jgi:hypothetical protein
MNGTTYVFRYEENNQKIITDENGRVRLQFNGFPAHGEKVAENVELEIVETDGEEFTAWFEQNPEEVKEWAESFIFPSSSSTTRAEVYNEVVGVRKIELHDAFTGERLTVELVGDFERVA